MELPTGTVFEGYRIDGVIGRGGMGVVYRAWQDRPRRAVALKVIGAQISADPEFRARFSREAELAASIEHPAIVPVHAVGEHEGHLFIAMRLVPGPDLSTLLLEGRIPESRAVAIVVQLASALNAAHQAGLIHRDVKPANVLVHRVGDEDRVYLTDFGLARHVAQTAGLTSIGLFLGTPGYAAPEQIRGEALDARADIYALGCLLYELLTGQLPFPRKDAAAIMWAHVNDSPPPLRSIVPDVSPRLDAVVAMAMAKQRSDRFATTTALARAAVAALGSTPLVDACPSCGTSIPNGIEFCGHCGADMNAIPAAAATRAMGTEPTRVGPPNRPIAEPAGREPAAAYGAHRRGSRRGPAWRIAAGALTVAAIIVFVLVRTTRHDAPRAAASASSNRGQIASVSSAASSAAPVASPTRTATSSRPPVKRHRNSTPVAPVPVNRVIAFQTGADPDKDAPAAYCRITPAELYCWTPNDGYTLRLTTGAPTRVGADESANRDRSPTGYDLLVLGHTRSQYGFACTSRRGGLSCQNAAGHGWTLPRYVGLPSLY